MRAINRRAGARLLSAGSEFERQTLAALGALGFKLELCGQAHDGGVDLRGNWSPVPFQTYSVLVQCKHRKSAAIGAGSIREFEGALRVHSKDSSILGVLASSTKFSAFAASSAMASPVPLALVCIDSEALRVTHFTPNPAFLRAVPSCALGRSLHQRLVFFLS
jgi:hypothetical protein